MSRTTIAAHTTMAMVIQLAQVSGRSHQASAVIAAGIAQPLITAHSTRIGSQINSRTLITPSPGVSGTGMTNESAYIHRRRKPSARTDVGQAQPGATLSPR